MTMAPRPMRRPRNSTKTRATRTRAKRPRPREGDLFLVPLNSGGLGVALIARFARELMLCYGFDRVYSQEPSLSELEKLTPTDCCQLKFLGNGAVCTNYWRTVGKLQSFNRTDWPNPPFRWYDRLVVFTGSDYFKLVELRGAVPEELLDRFPPHTGLGNVTNLEVSLDRAIREREPSFFIQIRSDSVALWNSVLEKAGLSDACKEPHA